jgi:hypothetical protein
MEATGGNRVLEALRRLTDSLARLRGLRVATHH